ncbi:mucin-2 isoform X1 [Episyrphus balteatus]|uniref:mucin-2 isoform X1 n=1 Tax=Episyrphus balteatus TaxID=286459 RepID=UPI002486C2E2|nr:mucin-2 isoform X1 [Episyrphus balteatus]
MFWRLCLILFIGVLLEWKLTHSAPAAENGKTKEKVRAYEFGFSIEEQQHRHEKRDENGIVMGEFGFITADGIYHVTVYATDENGKFKIISMKNYPYGGSPEKKIMIARLPPAKMPVVTTTKQPTTIKSLVPDGSSCGGCVKPKKMNLLPADVKGGKPDDEKAVFRPLSKALSNGKTNGEAVKVGKSTPTSKSVVGGNGKGTTGSKVPGSQPLVPPKVSTPGAQKTNGATSSKNGPGKNDKYGPLINVRLDSNSLTPPKTSTSGANVPTSPSKNGQGITDNEGNKYEITKSLTQTTSTPTQVLTQIPKIQEPSINSQFDDEDLLLTKTRGTIPSKFLNALATPNTKQTQNSQIYNTNNIQNTLSKTTTTSSLNTQNQYDGKATYPNSPTAVIHGSTFSPTTERKASANKMFLKPTITSSVGVPNGIKTTLPTPNISVLKDSLKISTLGRPDAQSTNENNPTDFNTRFSEENTLTTISKMTGRNSTPSGIKTTATPFSNLQAIYNTELSLNPTVQSFGPLSNQNTKTTTQQYTNTETKTNPTRNFTQFPKNSEYTVQKTLQNQIINSSQETNFPPAGENLQPQKSPNPSVITTIPSKTNSKTVLNTTPTISSIYPNNPTKSFTVPTKNGITQQYQKGSTNTATQNTGRPPFKTAKEPKSFQTLSKALPDEDSSVKNRLPQTSTLTTVPSKTRVLQKPGQSPSLITSRPQLISKNTIKTQPQLTTQTLIPKRLQQNTNEAKTTTTNTQSTNKQTPAVPSKQSTGKTTSSTNPAAGSGGIGGASSSGSAAGGGGGPLYKFNYVLDYNSHREEGRIDGSKEGNYNTIDEDGIRRIIDYIANENGYQPHIKLERLPPNEVPTGENKLKEYEFVWFN